MSLMLSMSAAKNWALYLEKHISCSRCRYKILLKSNRLEQSEATTDFLDVLCRHCEKQFRRGRKEYLVQDFSKFLSKNRFENEEIEISSNKKITNSTSEINSNIKDSSIVGSHTDKLNLPSLIPFEQELIKDTKNEKCSITDKSDVEIENEKQIELCDSRDSMITLDTIRIREKINDILKSLKSKKQNGKEQISQYDEPHKMETDPSESVTEKETIQKNINSSKNYRSQDKNLSEFVSTVRKLGGYSFEKKVQDENKTLQNYTNSSKALKELNEEQYATEIKVKQNNDTNKQLKAKNARKKFNIIQTFNEDRIQSKQIVENKRMRDSEIQLKKKLNLKKEKGQNQINKNQGIEENKEIQEIRLIQKREKDQKNQKKEKGRKDKKQNNQQQEIIKSKQDVINKNIKDVLNDAANENVKTHNSTNTEHVKYMSTKVEEIKSKRQVVKEVPLIFNDQNLIGDTQQSVKDLNEGQLKLTRSACKDMIQQSVKLNQCKIWTRAEDQEVPKGVIRYTLSDRTFIDKGWTMLPTEKVVRKINVYRMRPAHPEFDWFEHNKEKKVMYYDTGEKLAEFEDNGSGRLFYRNGKLALDYYDAEELNSKRRLVIYSNGEPDERGRTRPLTVLATFDYLGNGVVFDHAGKIRLKYNQTEGVLLDRNIGPISHWKWHTLNDPPVLQQVMIDTQMTHKDPDIIKLGESINDKQKVDNEDMLALELKNFIKENSKKRSQKFKPFQIRMKSFKINENFSLKILDQTTVYLIYRDGTINLKLNIGMIIDHKEIVDTDLTELGEIPNSIERFPAKTVSLAALQKNVKHAQRVERARVEREKRFRLAKPNASSDKLTAAISKPLRPQLTEYLPNNECRCRCRKSC